VNLGERNCELVFNFLTKSDKHLLVADMFIDVLLMSILLLLIAKEYHRLCGCLLLISRNGFDC
jgi:hypothetical protein